MRAQGFWSCEALCLIHTLDLRRLDLCSLSDASSATTVPDTDATAVSAGMGGVTGYWGSTSSSR